MFRLQAITYLFQVDEMASFCPKIEIINHFDNLINRIDIDIEESLEKYNELEDFEFSDWYDIIVKLQPHKFKCNFYNEIAGITSRFQKLGLWPDSMELIDCLKQIRMRTIEELRKAQEDTLEYFKLNLSPFKSELIKEKSVEELRSDLFADKFYFQVHLDQSIITLCPFNIFTFVTDFYLSSSDIDSLE